MAFAAVDGLHRAEVLACGGDAGRIALGMTEPHGFAEAEEGYFVDTGSPHYVRFVEDVERVDVRGEGRRVRNLPAFAGTGGVNVNFVEVAGEGTLKVRTYERGVEDETLACGTGSVAAAVVASRVRFPQVRSIDVQVRGGLLNVAFDVVGGRFSDVRLTGPARRVYSGVFRPENF